MPIAATFFLLILIFAIVLGSDTASKEERTEIKLTPIERISDKNEASFTVTMAINSGKEQKTYNLKATFDKTTVFDILKEASSSNNLEMKYDDKKYSFGVYIESIDGIKDGSGGKYWQYYVNGALGDVAADKKILKEGDKVEWRFEKVPF